VAATPLTVQTITRSGLVPVAQVNGDNVNGNTWANSGTQWLHVTNTGGSSATLTIAYPNPVDGQTVPARSYSMLAAGELRVGPFDPALFGTSPVITPSASTVKISVFQLG
jgi:hypothetical protein